MIISNALHTTRPQNDLMEFFDSKENWAAKHVKVGKINLAIVICLMSDSLALVSNAFQVPDNNILILVMARYSHKRKL